MKPGDLVVKRWGKIDPYQQGVAAIVINPTWSNHGLLLAGPLIEVVYPGRTKEIHKLGEFEVVSESR